MIDFRLVKSSQSERQDKNDLLVKLLWTLEGLGLFLGVLLDLRQHLLQLAVSAFLLLQLLVELGLFSFPSPGDFFQFLAEFSFLSLPSFGRFLQCFDFCLLSWPMSPMLKISNYANTELITSWKRKLPSWLTRDWSSNWRERRCGWPGEWSAPFESSSGRMLALHSFNRNKQYSKKWIKKTWSYEVGFSTHELLSLFFSKIKNLLWL